MQINRQSNLAKKEAKAKKARPGSVRMPRSYYDSNNGPLIEDHARAEASKCNGLSYAFPKGYYVPLRNADTKDGKSVAHTIYGEKPPKKGPIHYRNPRMNLKKHGDMSQRLAIRSKLARENPQKYKLGSL